MAFEAAYEKAKHRRAERERIREEMEWPEWYGTSNDPWASEAPRYPKYDDPYHVVLRDEPRQGHVWVTQPEAIEIDFTDGGPPKLREWQVAESDVDASYIELPWRIPRLVLETSGAHEAEQRGTFLSARKH